MPIGGTEQEVFVGAPVEQAFAKAKAALERTGKLTESDPAERFLRGTARYGLQKVRLKIDVEADQRGSIVRIRAQGDDVWDKGAKKVVERLAEALEACLDDADPDWSDHSLWSCRPRLLHGGEEPLRQAPLTSR